MRLGLSRVVSTLVLTLLAAGMGCGTPGKGGELVRTEPPAVQNSLCDSVADFGQPLIVDLKAHERAVYEAVMQDGVAVVKYDCNHLQLLKDCKIDGSYGFVGLSPKEEVVRLQGSDEIRVNLPTFGAKLATEVSRDASLDLGMIMVGMRRTTVTEADRPRMKGNACAGATHFVRGAFVGAFALRQGSSGSVSGALEILGSGVSAASSSSKRTENRDGDASACKNFDPKSSSPDGKCAALLRLELTAIDVKPVDNAGTVDVCPKDLVLTAGKCAPPSASLPFQCREGQREECAAQCEKGHAGSCAALGFMFFGAHGVNPDPEQAAKLSQKACDGGSSRGCNNLGRAYEVGEALPKDVSKARELYAKACEGGFARGCTNLGVLAEQDKDLTRANSLFDRGCNAGDARGCHYLALNLDKGAGAARDAERAKALFERACDGKFGDACALLSSKLVGGSEEQRAKGLKELEQNCNQGTASACRFLGGMRLTGSHLPRDPAAALKNFEKGCEAKDAPSCADGARLALAGTEGLSREPSRGIGLAKKACDGGLAQGCRLLALAFVQGAGAAKDDAAALKLLEKSCSDGDGESCAGAGLLYRDGQSVGRNASLAVGMFEKSCRARYAYGCALLASARFDGIASVRDDGAAREAMSRACSFGLSPACGGAYVAPKLYPVNEWADGPKKTTAYAAEVQGSPGPGDGGSPALEARRSELTKRMKGKLGALKACPRSSGVNERAFRVGFSVDPNGKTTLTESVWSGDKSFDACLKRTLAGVKVDKGEHTINGTALLVVQKKVEPSMTLQIAPDPSEFTLPASLRRLGGCSCTPLDTAVVCALECRTGSATMYAWTGGTGIEEDPLDPFRTTAAAAAAAAASPPKMSAPAGAGAKQTSPEMAPQKSSPPKKTPKKEKFSK